MNIRVASKDDLELLQKLNNELFLDNQKYDSDLDLDWPLSDMGNKYFSEFLENPDACIFIAEIENKPVGYILAEVREIEYRKGKYAFLENMGVIQEYRNKGIGSRLIDELIKWAKDREVKKVYVTSYLKNEGATEFYRKSRFSDIDLTLEKVI